MEICTVGSVRGESIGKHAGAFSYSENEKEDARYSDRDGPRGWHRVGPVRGCRLRSDELCECAQALLPASAATNPTEEQLLAARSAIQPGRADGQKHSEHARALPRRVLAVAKWHCSEYVRQHQWMDDRHQFRDGQWRLPAGDHPTPPIQPGPSIRHEC